MLTTALCLCCSEVTVGQKEMKHNHQIRSVNLLKESSSSTVQQCVCVCVSVCVCVCVTGGTVLQLMPVLRRSCDVFDELKRLTALSQSDPFAEPFAEPFADSDQESES